MQNSFRRAKLMGVGARGKSRNAPSWVTSMLRPPNVVFYFMRSGGLMFLDFVKGAAVAVFLVGATAAQAVEIRVFASTALKSTFDEIVPVFEQRSGHKLVLPYYSSADTRKRMKAGEAFDVAITEFEAFQELVKEGVTIADPLSVI